MNMKFLKKRKYLELVNVSISNNKLTPGIIKPILNNSKITINNKIKSNFKLLILFLEPITPKISFS